MGFVQKITEWLLEKEEEAAKSCTVPMQEIEYQIAKAQAEKEKLQKRYDGTQPCSATIRKNKKY